LIVTSASGQALGNVKQLYKLKKDNRQLRVLLSVGGYTGSVNMSQACGTDATRSTFASTAVSLMKDWGFDGIDIDYEFPNTTTAGNNFSLLLKAIREELDSYSKQYANNYHFLLSIAVSSAASNYGLLPLKDIAANVDYFNLMAYDYTGSWSTATGHQANLYNSTSNPDSTPISTDSAIKAYIAGGVKASQIVLGMPIYGRSFESTAGLGKSFKGVGTSSFGEGVWSYKDLPKANATEKYDNETVATYSYDPNTQELISYDTPTSVKQKVAYLKSKGLGGSMFWEVSADRTDSRSLVAASYSSLGNLTTAQNCLSYPNSTYTNIKNNLS
jgi:chitinase